VNSQPIIGTSGWHYQHWRGIFYPPKLPSSGMLDWYARSFSTVEINHTFYRLPTEEALLRWREIAPAGFIFALKGSRFITHIKRLRDPERAVALFFSRVELLQEKLGPILFQLPPNWSANLKRLEKFLVALPRVYHYAVEFRDFTWYTPAIYDLLRKYNVALCLHDWRDTKWPMELTADFTYIRFHGPSGRYHGNYNPKVLKGWADRIEQWRTQLSHIYVYFNNDQDGYALKNAETLKKQCERSVYSTAA
jgi:uncharacterized protein YecE (DUF72 family)